MKRKISALELDIIDVLDRHSPTMLRNKEIVDELWSSYKARYKDQTGFTVAVSNKLTLLVAAKRIKKEGMFYGSLGSFVSSSYKEDVFIYDIQNEIITRERTKKYELALQKVPEMFEKGNHLFPLFVKDVEKLGLEQLLVLWFDSDILQFLHAARKIVGNKIHVSDRGRASKNIDDWITETANRIRSDWIESLRWIAEEGKESWEEILGSYEDNRLPLYLGLCKFSRTLQNAREEENREFERKVKSGEIKAYKLE